MPASWRAHFRGPLVRAVGVVLLANLLFLALMIVAPGDPDVMVKRIRTAFEHGELGLADYLPFDSRRGWHQYNDCNVLQMLSNADPSRLRRSLAPTVYYADSEFRASCPVLHALTVGHVDRGALFTLRYARYWHGYNAPIGFALRLIELRTVRLLLSGLMWLAIVVLALASYRSGIHTRRAALSIATAAALVWAVPYFAPGFTHGPGDALVMLALAGIVAWPRAALDLDVIAPYAAGFGATVAFLEMLTGQLPVAAAWLVVLTLAAGRDGEGPAGRRARVAAVAAAIAFVMAASMTVFAKQVLALALVEPDAGVQFLWKIQYYTGVPEPEDRWPGIMLPYRQLVRSSSMLTYGSGRAGRVLIAASIVAWLWVALRAWRRRPTGNGRDLLMIAAAALSPIAWVLVLPLHTYIHAPFMVRILVVPISLAMVALCWPRVVPGKREPRAGFVPRAR